MLALNDCPPKWRGLYYVSSTISGTDVKAQPRHEKIKSALAMAAGILGRTSPSPDEAMKELFADVQTARVYSDGKVFPDLVPRRRMKEIQKEYLLAKADPDFDLREFVSRHFYEFGHPEAQYSSNPTHTPRQHITELWHVLERRNRRARGSLIAIPHSYIVPGGRFSEQFYWDSYFIMLGLAVDNHWDMIEGMIKNYCYMLTKFGLVPTANRTYFLSRSQPPFFVHMVKLLARHKGGRRTLLEYLPYLVLERRFWMKGKNHLENGVHLDLARVVKMPDGTILNRYYDDKLLPRPESLREDIETARLVSGVESYRIFLDLRAGAESGWDFSSRWFADPNDIHTIHTTDIIPVDLNCLLYQLEITIAEGCRLLLQPRRASRILAAAERRKQAILDYCWGEKDNFFGDYDFKNARITGRFTLAGVFPLYAGIATTAQAAAVAVRLERDFLKPGGLAATTYQSGQQWDSPNGWAPLQWVAIQGLRNYGYYRLAEEIKARWVKTNLDVFAKTGKLVEKYDVVHGAAGGGGEYPLQDGFGWTNGVLADLLAEDERANR